MRIEHIAMWVSDIDETRKFYQKYFGMKASEYYVNQQKGFMSCFLSFESGARLEIMTGKDIIYREEIAPVMGLAHFAISLGSIAAVNKITRLLRKDGYKIIGGPRVTGDGYYESVVLGPEGNQIEITV